MEIVTQAPSRAAVDRTDVSWRAVFAGTAVAALTYVILASLGLAIGGANLQGAIRGGDSIGGLGLGAGIWLVVSAFISLFIGGFAAGRVGGLQLMRVGRIQGAVVAALFFGLLLSQLGGAISGLGQGLGSLIGLAGSAAGDLSQNPQVQAVVGDALGDLDLQSPPAAVARGVATRLLKGDADGARNYLARQAGITPAQAQSRIDGLRQDFDRTAKDVGATAAKVARIAGWTLFGTLLLGTLSAMLGGGAAAGMNLRRPLDRSDRRAIDKAA